MATEISFNHMSQDSLIVTNTPALLPQQRAMDGSGNYKTGPDGRPLYLTPRHVLIYVATQPIRWRADSIAPDSAPGMGMFVAAGSYITWTDPLADFSQLIKNVKFIRAEGSTGNGLLEISFFN